MFKTRIPSVTCLIVSLISIPWAQAFASDLPVTVTESGQSAAQAPTGITDSIRSAPQQYRLEARRQSVASTTEPNLLLGITAGALIVAGASLAAYGATSSCKGSHASSASCDKRTMIGTLALSGGATMLVLWALSRP